MSRENRGVGLLSVAGRVYNRTLMELLVDIREMKNVEISMGSKRLEAVQLFFIVGRLYEKDKNKKSNNNMLACSNLHARVYREASLQALEAY